MTYYALMPANWRRLMNQALNGRRLSAGSWTTTSTLRTGQPDFFIRAWISL